MQGISKTRHVHLLDALQQLEGLLTDRQTECICLQKAEDYKLEMKSMYRNYEHLLKALSRQISAYEILYSEVKV